METRVLEDGEIQNDYIAHGSDEHLQWLGLREATPDDEIQYKGYALVTEEPYGLFWEEGHLRSYLRSKVSGFLTKPPMPQSVDPNAPGFAPEPWLPREPSESPVRGIV